MAIDEHAAVPLRQNAQQRPAGNIGLGHETHVRHARQHRDIDP
jgi:hypothetical protein